MAGTALGQPGGDSTFINPTEVRIPHIIESGPLDNNSDRPAILFEQVIETPDAAWSTAYFSAIDLQPGSILRISSLRDNEIQELDAFTAKMWGRRSAYFNGSRIRIQVEAAPNTRGNRIALEAVGAQFMPLTPCNNSPCSTCTPDTRVPSDESWSGRWLGGGCTASIYNENSCFVSAGHCFTIANVTVLGFNIPSSLGDCTMQQPPVADQFPVIETVRDMPGGSCAPDWRVGRLGLNSLGQTHYQRYSAFRPIAGAPPPVNSQIDLFAFGSSCIPELNGTQQKTTAVVTGVSSVLFAATGGTTTGGTSGGAWIHDNAIAGINTCCGITASRMDQPQFVSARQQMCSHTVHAPWDQPFCLNQMQTNVPITVCNTSGTASSYQLSFTGLPAGSAGSGCAVNGPTGFTVVGPSIIGPIPSGECLTVQVVINRPPGLTAADLTGCYEVTALSLNTGGIAVTDHGSVQDKRNLCAVFKTAGSNGGPVAIPVGEVQRFTLDIRNDRVPSGVLNYRIEAFDTKMETSGAIAVNGNYVGLPGNGSLKIPVGSTGELDFTLSYRWLEPFDISDIVISTDVDGNGNYRPLTSIGVRSLDKTMSVGSDPPTSPHTLRLLPNPTRETTAISFALEERGSVTLGVHDLTGRLIRTLLNAPLDAGDHTVVWDGNDDSGRRVAAGIYVAELIARGDRRSVKIVQLP